jgi:hypothetical protein
MLAMLSRLSIGLDRKAPVANLAPALLIVSNIFRAFLFALIMRNALYSSLDKIRDLYIIDRVEKDAPQLVWANIFIMFNLNEQAFF